MKRFSNAVVKWRVPILILSLILLIPSAIGFINTRINYDILYYLPKDIETMKGQDVLMDDFGKGAYAIFVCDEMSSEDAEAMSEKIKQVDHVASVLSLADLDIPVEMLPQKVQDIFYSKDGTGQLMFIFFDTTTSADATMDSIEKLYDIAGDQCFVSSMSCIVTDTRDMVKQELFWYVLIAVVLATIAMAIFLDSFVVPGLFLVDIGIAIIYNLGTNIIQGEISFITMSLAAVLQLGVTMDYSIFLYHSYKEKKLTCPDNEMAMSEAICATITSVTGSSLTTIAGFIALCFMSFTLGLDLGVVMAKGVFIGVICCVTVLPGIILMNDRVIQKTSHRPARIPCGRMSRFVTKHYRIMALIMLVLWVPAVYGYTHYNVYYKLDNSLPAYLNSVKANAKLDEDYDMNSISMLLVSDDISDEKMAELTNEINDLPGITFAASLDSMLDPEIPREILPDDVRSTLESDNWKLMLAASEYQVATDEIADQCDQMNKILKSYDPKGMMIGEAACTQDLIKITDKDFMNVSVISIAAIFVLILLVLKSALLPIILVLTIELAIYVNMGLSFYTGATLPFIASICIGTIQLGATVDYAILMTTRYKQERIGGKNAQEAVASALTGSMHSIVTSAMGFFAATIGVGLYSDVDLIGSLCLLMARGALISMVIVIVFLPSLLMLFDRPICALTKGMPRRKKKASLKKAVAAAQEA